MLEHQPGETYTDEFGVEHVFVYDTDVGKSCSGCSLIPLGVDCIKVRCLASDRGDRKRGHYELKEK